MQIVKIFPFKEAEKQIQAHIDAGWKVVTMASESTTNGAKVIVVFESKK